MTIPYTFGSESSPIPLSQLDANFATIPNYANTAGNVVNSSQPAITSVGALTALSVVGNTVSGNYNSAGQVSVVGNVVAGNVVTGGLISAYGSVTAGSLHVAADANIAGNMSLVGTITGANFNTPGQVSVAGNVIAGNVNTVGRVVAQGNILAQGTVSATGNIVTAGYFVGNFLGNITGNLSVGGSNTQVLFNQNGNVGAAGGLTYNSGSNVLTVLGVVSAQGNLIGGNASVAGTITASTAQFAGLVTAPTPVANTANNQIATTAFVSSTLGTLGTMARQNAISVAIAGGTIGNAIITLASVANSSINASTITNSTIDQIVMPGGWTITPVGSTLYFSFGNVNVAKLDSSGNFTAAGDVTAFGSI